MKIILMILGVLLISFWVGGMNALSALRDPDTCWLLSLGKIICQHGLPTSDPFSYTYYLMSQSGHARPFVMYQWLAEVLLHLTQHVGGLTGLILLVSAITSITFTVMPNLCLRWAKVDFSLTLLVGGLAQLGCAFRFFARPELFSLALFAAALGLLYKIVQRPTPKLIALNAALVVLWCNIHASFTLAILLSLLPLISLSINKFRSKTDADSSTAPPLVLLIALPLIASLASLINPYGVGLWTYLPKLFFLKIAFQETRQLNFADFGHIELYPFLLLMLVYIFCLFKKGLDAKNAQDKYYPLHLLLAVIAIVLAFSSIRLIVYTLVIIAFELPQLLPKMELAHKSRLRFAIVLAPVMCLIGSLYVSQVLASPQLPQPMHGFAPPSKAITFINARNPNGPILNDARFGDLMIYYLKPPVPVFIDTRFDMYGEELYEDYANLCTCGPGWQKMMADFGFVWIFMPPDRPLVKALKNDPAWTVIFSDDTAIILEKK